MNGNTVRVQLSIDSRPRRKKPEERVEEGKGRGEIKGANCGIIVWSSSSKNFDRNFGHFKLNLHASRVSEDESKNSRKSVTKRV